MHALYKYRKKILQHTQTQLQQLLRHQPSYHLRPYLFFSPTPSFFLCLTDLVSSQELPQSSHLSSCGCTGDNASQDNSEYFLPAPQRWCLPRVGSEGPCSLFSPLITTLGRFHITCIMQPTTWVFWENGLKNNFISCPMGKCVQAEQGKAILQSSTVLTTALLIAAWRNRKTWSSIATKKWAWLNWSDSQFWLTCLTDLFKKNHFWNNSCVFFLNCLPLHSFKVIAKAQSQCRSKQTTMMHKCILKP